MKLLPRLRLWAVVAALLVGGYAAFKVSPWPGALLARAVFTLDARHSARMMEKYVPADVSAHRNLRYSDTGEGKDGYLDIYYPSEIRASDRLLPTVVWVHGGGWVSGSKDDVANYARIIAGKGYTVAAVNYSLAPRAKYPIPVRQVNSALRYLRENAHRFHIDASTFVLAGDSAGSHIVAQLANGISVPAYAEALAIEPAIGRPQLAAVILYCGAYDLKLVHLDGPFAPLVKTLLWAYGGSKDFMSDQAFASASVINYVTPAFPPAFVSAGNGDPLESQSRIFAKTLASRGVKVEPLFFPGNYSPPLPHEYQFKLDTEAAQLALERSLAFLAEQTR